MPSWLGAEQSNRGPEYGERKPCPRCKEKKTVLNKKGEPIKCPECRGKGFVFR